MEFLTKRLNYVISELDRLLSVNSGGCCYLCYRIAYWLEKYQIKYQFVIQDNIPIRNLTGKHYCLKLCGTANSTLFINKNANKYSFIKTVNLNSMQILEKYKCEEWSKKYNSENNSFIDNIIASIFEVSFVR